VTYFQFDVFWFYMLWGIQNQQPFCFDHTFGLTSPSAWCEASLCHLRKFKSENEFCPANNPLRCSIFNWIIITQLSWPPTTNNKNTMDILTTNCHFCWHFWHISKCLLSYFNKIYFRLTFKVRNGCSFIWGKRNVFRRINAISIKILTISQHNFLWENGQKPQKA
jgi:hypothetical protein